MRGIMTARTKPIKLVEPAPFDPLTEVVLYEMPNPAQPVSLWMQKTQNS